MHDQVVLVLAFIIVAVIGRIVWPLGPCRRCGGSGRRAGSNRWRWAYCGRCSGSGEGRRFGARRG